MALAEALAGISAAMQAVDLWIQMGGTRETVVTSLNIQYQPERFRQVDLEVRRDEPLNYDFWVAVYSGIEAQVQKCRQYFLESIGDEELLPPQREKLGTAFKACACKALRQAKDAMPGRDLPPTLENFWQSFGCTKYFGGVQSGAKIPWDRTGLIDRQEPESR